MSDLISRQAILKHIEKIRQSVQMMDDIHRASIIINGMHLCEEAVRNQPSVQPEQLTDIEQRIFLAAMSRERKICKKAEEEYYGVDILNLVRVCREIERKVKKALWTN